ncbi:DUF3179 domain-containing protein [Patescibacteria group bacterium]|nr:DUF3179 domain-containing protein [Patescibacteria group bacterium]
MKKVLFLISTLSVIVVISFVIFSYSKTDSDIQSVKQPPVASVIISEWTVTIKGNIRLETGFTSHDPDGGEIVYYRWEVAEAPVARADEVGRVIYEGTEPSKSNILLPELTANDIGTWTFKFSVTDDEGETGSKNVIVKVRKDITALASTTLVPIGENKDLADSDIIAGVVVNDEAVAFPRTVMDNYAIANSIVGEEPIVLVLCEFCQTGVAYYRTVEGQVLSFSGFGGTLLEDDYKVEDNETKSTWAIVQGKAVDGLYNGKELLNLEVRMTTWGEWVGQHPDTLVLVN